MRMGPWPMGTKSKKGWALTSSTCDVCFVRNRRISESPAGGVGEMYHDSLCTKSLFSEDTLQNTYIELMLFMISQISKAVLGCRMHFFPNWYYLALGTCIWVISGSRVTEVTEPRPSRASSQPRSNVEFNSLCIRYSSSLSTSGVGMRISRAEYSIQSVVSFLIK